MLAYDKDQSTSSLVVGSYLQGAGRVVTIAKASTLYTRVIQ